MPGTHRGRDQHGETDQGRMHRSRRRQLRQRTEPPLRQSRRGGPEVVQMQHAQPCRKPDTAHWTGRATRPGPMQRISHCQP
jgi:hypothetical protein